MACASIMPLMHAYKALPLSLLQVFIMLGRLIKMYRSAIAEKYNVSSIYIYHVFEKGVSFKLDYHN